jgi:ribA/ribD-fused uncharacterized protein
LENKTEKIRIYFPYNIGCGLAKGNWKDYFSIIKLFSMKLLQDIPTAKVKIISKEDIPVVVETKQLQEQDEESEVFKKTNETLLINIKKIKKEKSSTEEKKEEKEEKHNYLFFYSEKGENGIYSQWYPSEFKEKYDFGDETKIITFKNAEQYMMFRKALLFNDMNIAYKILETISPREIKNLGREIKNFNATTWNKEKFEIVKRGNYLKFKQNKNLKETLLSHCEKIFVEASPYDRIWGIGFSKDKALDNISNWGENLLGKALNEVCKKFQS